MRKFRVAINGTTYEVDIEEISSGESSSTIPPVSTTTARSKATEVPPTPPAAPPQPKAAPNGVEGPVVAQMPGTIIDIFVNKGDSVKRGQSLLILEAMKMANEVVAPYDGTIAEIHVIPKASVNAGDVLVSLN